MVNVALQTAYIGAGSPLGAGREPYMIYDSNTKLFSIIGGQLFDTNNIKIYFNSRLYSKLSNFNSKYVGNTLNPNKTTGMDYEILLKNTYNNSITIPVGSPNAGALGYVNTQDFVCLSLLNSFKRIVFLTGSIPIKAEYLNISSNVNVTNNNFLPILTDFVPSNPNGYEFRTGIVYYPTAEYRMTDLWGDSPLSTIDLQVYWIDVIGILRPLYFPVNSECTIKILFRKKTLVNYLSKVENSDLL
jgi:hypothetical protein